MASDVYLQLEGIKGESTPKAFSVSSDDGMVPLRLLVLAFAPVATSAAAAIQYVECPSEISQASIRIVGTPGGWSTYVASPLYLHSAGAAAAPPEKLANLVGESIGQPGRSKEWFTSYKFEGKSPDGKWMECGYGEYNQVIVSKRLADDTSECKVSYRKGEKAGQNALKISCK